MLGLNRLQERRPSAAAAIRFALALAAGWLASFALPPTGVFVAQLPAYSLLIVLLSRSRTLWGGFGVCWAFAFAYHLSGLSWVGEAFLVDAERFAWMRPFALTGLPAGLALLAGLAGMAFVWLRRRLAAAPLADVLLFAALFMAAEWLRGNILTGFPWNLPIHGWDAAPAVLQGVAWIGPYGLSLLAVLAGGALVPLLSPGPWRARIAGALVLVLPLAIVAGAGAVRLANAPAEMASVEGVKLRLVQPSIPQKDKWRPELRAIHFEKHLRLSAGAAAAGVTHIIWPEAATAFMLRESPGALARIAAVTPAGGAVIVGTPSRTGPAAPGGESRYTNAIVVIADGGQVTATYDKHHLVPFGEYVPMREWLPLERLAPGHGSFSEGPGPQTLAVPGAPPFSPMICYEAIFPGEVVDSRLRPGWLLNLTNDAWFGTSAGPHQHLAIARLRTIEEGLPMVRVASTGITAVIDAYGRTQETLGIGLEGYIDAELPVALPPEVVTLPDSISFSLLLILVVTASLYQSFVQRHTR